MTAADLFLVAGATVRLTRFVTTDDLGAMLVKEPVTRRLMEWRPSSGKADRLLDGLECPFCVGYWIGVGVLTTYAASRADPCAHRLWRFVAAGLTLNYVTAHLSARLDS